MEYLAPGIQPGIPKKPFNIIGLACFVILVVSAVLQLVLYALTRWFASPLEGKSWYIWAVTFLPLYAVAVPIGITLFRCIPAERAAVRKLRFKDLLIFLVMCFPVMYIGNIIGALLNAALHALLGTEIKNPLDVLMSGSNMWLAALVMVILAPVIEEFIFRKLIIDRMRAYGEGACVLVSGLLFGLFHGNLAQFFYAFGLGAIFAFIYLKTGRLRYPIFLHMAINFYSGIIGPLLLRGVDLDAIPRLGSADTRTMMQWLASHLPSLMALGLYSIVNLALVITGFVLLIVRRRAFFFERGPLQPERGTGFKVLFLNIGMALFAAAALAMFILSLF